VRFGSLFLFLHKAAALLAVAVFCEDWLLPILVLIILLFNDSIPFFINIYYNTDTDRKSNVCSGNPLVRQGVTRMVARETTLIIMISFATLVVAIIATTQKK